MNDNANLKEWAMKWNYVFWQSSKLVGAPVLFCLMLLFLQKLVFTGTCAFAGYQCKESLTYATAIAAKVNEAVSGGAGGVTASADTETIHLQGFPPESRNRVMAAADKESKRLAALGQ
jgi:hypothetical protein